MAQRNSRTSDCRTCRFFMDDPHELERALVGVLALSSTYGSACGDSGICAIHDTFQYPLTDCGHYRSRGGCFEVVAGDVTQR